MSVWQDRVGIPDFPGGFIGGVIGDLDIRPAACSPQPPGVSVHIFAFEAVLSHLLYIVALKIKKSRLT